MTPHISAPPDAFAPDVIMPGDPLRARRIANTMLDDAQQVTAVRGMEGYTGTYDGREPMADLGSRLGLHGRRYVPRTATSPRDSHRIRKRRGEQRALIAVAHTLPLICWYILHDGTEHHKLGPGYLAGKDQPRTAPQAPRRPPVGGRWELPTGVDLPHRGPDARAARVGRRLT